MWNSRSQIQLILGVLCFLFPLVGCWKATPNNLYAALQQTNFLVQSVEGEGAPTEEVNSDAWKMARSRHYHFWACLVDRATPQIIRGISFKILAEKGEKIEAVTDTKGCLHWYERTEFDPLDDETYVQLDRTIEGTGVYTGSIKVKIAIDPWMVARKSTGLKEVVWMRDEMSTDLPKRLVSTAQKVHSVLKSSESQKALQAEEVDANGNRKKKTKRLWVSRLNSLIKEKGEAGTHAGDGVSLEIVLSMDLNIAFRDLSGNPVSLPLKAGNFRVDAQLIASNVGENRNEGLILTPDLPPVFNQITEFDGHLRVSIHSVMTRRVRRGNLRIALKVTPLNGPDGLGSFEGLFELSDANHLEGKTADLFLAEETFEGKGFSYEKFLESTSSFESLKARRQAFDETYYEFPEMTVKFQTIRPGETATTRTVEYAITSCIRNPRTSAPYKNELFYTKYLPDSNTEALDKVFYADEMKQEQPWCDLYGNSPDKGKECKEIPKTDDNGCLRIAGHVTHKFYQPEELSFPEIEIKHVSGRINPTKLKLAINPWDLFATFGSDYRALSKEYLESVKGREKIKSMIFIHQFSYNTLRFRYEIDEFMNLVVKKMVLFKMEPVVLRYSSITNGRMSTNHLRDGIYLLKLALEKNYIDAATPGVQVGYDLEGKKSFVITPEDMRLKNYITGERKLVRVQDGMVVTPVEFELRDLRILRLRSNFLIQLEPIDEKKLTMLNEFKDQLEKEYPNLKAEYQRLQNQRSDQAKVAAQYSSQDRKQSEFDDYIRTMMAPLRSQMEGPYLQTGTMPNNVPYKNSLGQISELYKPANLTAVNEFDYTGLLSDDFFRQVTFNTLKAYKKNDVTNVSLAPIVSLNSLLEPDSGLEPRSFAGPLTLLLNGNSSYVRPTDNLEESFCSQSDDCKEELVKEGLTDKEQFPGVSADPKENVHPPVKLRRSGEVAYADLGYSHSSYNGSIYHLRNVKLDDVLKEMVDLERAFQVETLASSLLYNYVKKDNLNFVSLKDEVLKKFDLGRCSQLPVYENDLEEQCLTPDTEASKKFQDFLNNLNQIHKTQESQSSSQIRLIGSMREFEDSPPRPFKEVSSGEIENFIFKGELNHNLNYAFCSYFENQIKGTFLHTTPRDSLLFENLIGFDSFCVYAQEHRDPKVIFHVPLGGSKNSGLILERKLRIYKTGRNRFVGGKPLNINVSSGFTSAFQESFSGGFNYNLLSDFPMGKSLVGMLGKYFASLFSLSEDKTRSHNQNLMVTEGAFLAVQEAQLNVEALEYENCLMIRPNPDFIKNYFKNNQLFKDVLAEKNTDHQGVKIDLAKIFKGLMLCSGKIEKKPLPIPENYYYFSQHFVEGDLLDSADIFNHPWLLLLRGEDKYRDFYTMIRAVPHTYDLVPINTQPAWTLKHLMNAYRRVDVAFPGLYTVLDNEEYQENYPNNLSPAESFGDKAYGIKREPEEEALIGPNRSSKPSLESSGSP